MYLLELTAAGVLTVLKQEKDFNTLEMKAVQKALFAFQDRTVSEDIIMKSDNFYGGIHQQTGELSQDLC